MIATPEDPGAAQLGDVGQEVDPQDETPEGGLGVPHCLEFVITTVLSTEGRGHPADGVLKDWTDARGHGLQGEGVRDLTHARGGATSLGPDPNLVPVPRGGSALDLPAGGRGARTGASSERAPSLERASCDRPPILTKMRRKHGSKSRCESGRKRPRPIWPRRNRRARRACLSPVSTSSQVATEVIVANDLLT